MQTILMVISFLSWAQANVDLEAHCPDVSPINNFNFSAYADGLWYEIARYSNNWESRGDCVTLEFIPENNGTRFIIVDITDRTKKYVEGYVDLSTKAHNTGVIIYNSNTFTEGEGSEEVPLYILDTDYKNYAIIYECKYDKNTRIRQDYAWILSRTRKLDEHFQKIVDNFLKTSFIDRTKFIWEQFTEDLCKIIN